MNNTEKINYIESQALKDIELPPDIKEQSEQLLFLQLRVLYRDFQAGKISKEQGSREKSRLISAYEVADLHRRAGQQSAAMVVMLGECISDAYKNRDNCPVCNKLSERYGADNIGKTFELRDGEVVEVEQN